MLLLLPLILRTRAQVREQPGVQLCGAPGHFGGQASNANAIVLLLPLILRQTALAQVREESGFELRGAPGHFGGQTESHLRRGAAPGAC